MKYRQGDTRYAFAVGKVRQLESTLLGKDSFERMLEAENAEEALRLLAENPQYSQDAQELKNIKEFEKILEKQLDKLYSLIHSLCMQPELTELCRVKHDIYNLKTAIKYFFSETKKEAPFLTARGNVDGKLLMASIEKKQFREMPPGIAAIAKQAIEYFQREKDPQGLDALLDRLHFDFIFANLDRRGHAFLYRYFQYCADLANVRIFLRAKEQQRTIQFLKEALIDNGLIKKQDLARLYEQPFREFAKELQRIDYWSKLGDALEEWEKTGVLDEFEKQADDYLLGYLKQAKYLAFGFEPVAGYLFAKENEVKQVRDILVGKLYDRTEEEIRRTLRQSYV